jgi:hypothetical protein
MTYTKLVSKKELKSLFGVPYSFQHIARIISMLSPTKLDSHPVRSASSCIPSGIC